MRYRYYTAILETLSPVHIGCGEKLTKLDYVYSEKSRTVYVLQPMKLFHGLQQFHLLESFEKGLPRNTSMTDFLVQNSVPEQAYASWAMYSFPAQRSVINRGQYDIQKFVKDAYGMPYIPGSGLKGALRTVLATDSVRKNTSSFQNMTQRITREIDQNVRFKKAFLSRETSQIESDIFHTLQRNKEKKYDIVNDCMAGLIISDSSPAAKESLSLSKKIDQFRKGEENPINTLRETLKMNTKLTFEITIDTSLFKFSVKEILQAGENAFSFYDDTFRSIFLDYLPPEIDPEREMYIYLGGGTGFHHKTFLNALFTNPTNPEQGAECTAKLLDLQFPRAKHTSFTKREGYSPKAIKMTKYEDRLEEMGLCKLRFEERKI